MTRSQELLKDTDGRILAGNDDRDRDNEYNDSKDTDEEKNQGDIGAVDGGLGSFGYH